MDYKKQISNCKVSVQFIAEKLGINPVVLSYYINGKRNMPLGVEDKIKDVLRQVKAIQV